MYAVCLNCSWEYVYYFTHIAYYRFMDYCYSVLIHFRVCRNVCRVWTAAAAMATAVHQGAFNPATAISSRSGKCESPSVASTSHLTPCEQFEARLLLFDVIHLTFEIPENFTYQADTEWRASRRQLRRCNRVLWVYFKRCQHPVHPVGRAVRDAALEGRMARTPRRVTIMWQVVIPQVIPQTVSHEELLAAKWGV
jgi:hypothetical protein